MCGILGVRRSWLDDASRVEAAVAAMEWRGPDGHAIVSCGDWRLAVARLTITDPENGQPLWSADRRRVVAFNGTVTSAGVETVGLRPATNNDAELPLHRLATGGAPGLLQTSGHYALAILEPATDRLWLARDPEGEKPLYIVRRGDEVVAFASTVASLRRLGLRIELDERERARFLRFGFALRPTVLTPGLQLDSDLRGVRLHRGADVPKDWIGETSRGGSMDLRDRVVAAASRCASAEVPVALCLSGGVDSSCLAAALRHGDRTLPAYQFCARGAPTAERRLAQRVATHTGMPLRLVDAGPDILRDLPRLTRLVGLPTGDPSLLAVHALARAAAADGVRVLLSGEGADELFLGYRRHRVARRLPRWATALVPARLVPDLSMSTVSRLCRAVTSPEPYEALLEVAPPGFRRAVFVPELAGGELPPSAAATMLHRAREVDRSYYLRHDLLPKLDTALMAAGVEGRCPYLDPEVVRSPEATAGDPRAILGKHHLRAAFRDGLPRGILAAKKRGFGLPLDRWLREDSFVPDLLRDRRTRERSHLRPDGLAGMLDRHLAGRSALGHALYLIAALECHLRDAETGS